MLYVLDWGVAFGVLGFVKSRGLEVASNHTRAQSLRSVANMEVAKE